MLSANRNNNVIDKTVQTEKKTVKIATPRSRNITSCVQSVRLQQIHTSEDFYATYRRPY